ncbi:hypothetical protein D0869_00207 [Hortaea werneckii]|uniref:Uncharacterized protein n=1 Tax=Hortaea werneckii TaxID=91943 RepID=A0A3M6Y922_HORWE|nr:hypothetical protein D0869_00207 [Hortaea werneckii]RMX99537.1 hypothetical protein D0867_12072 [Hortaea werneckii]RMY16809.1 hypothetical protein D0868_00093 [Hortaea werneckii]RMY39935.1 hypothetical protein D0866_01598 [Hortaea werneckii]
MESRKRSRSGSDPKENKRSRGDDSGPQASFDLPLRISQKTTANNGQSNTSTAANEGAEEKGSGDDARPGPSSMETPEMPIRQNTTGDESPEEYESPGEASGSDTESTDQEPSLGDEAVFSTAQMSNPGNASLAAKFQSLDKIRTRLGRDIDELLLKRIQPAEQVTIQEINAWLSAKVDARQQREGRVGPGNAAIRENEVYQVIDDVKAMGRPIVQVGGEEYDEDDNEGYGGGYDDVDDYL